MMPPDTLTDGGFLSGSYDCLIGGFWYTLDTIDDEIPVSQADAMKADGTPKGGAFVKGKRKLSVKINAITGTPKPASLTPFQFALYGEAAKWWAVTNLKIASSNSGAQIRTYSADIVEQINAPTLA